MEQTNDNLYLYNTDNPIFRPLSNHAFFPMTIFGKNYKTVTNFIYSMILNDNINKEILRNSPLSQDRLPDGLNMVDSNLAVIQKNKKMDIYDVFQICLNEEKNMDTSIAYETAYRKLFEMYPHIKKLLLSTKNIDIKYDRKYLGKQLNLVPTILDKLRKEYRIEHHIESKNIKLRKEQLAVFEKVLAFKILEHNYNNNKIDEYYNIQPNEIISREMDNFKNGLYTGLKEFYKFYGILYIEQDNKISIHPDYIESVISLYNKNNYPELVNIDSNYDFDVNVLKLLQSKLQKNINIKIENAIVKTFILETIGKSNEKLDESQKLNLYINIIKKIPTNDYANFKKSVLSNYGTSNLDNGVKEEIDKKIKDIEAQYSKRMGIFKQAQSEEKQNEDVEYVPTSPGYVPTSPGYVPEDTYDYKGMSPENKPGSPGYNPTSPAYKRESPAYNPSSPVYNPTSPAKNTEKLNDLTKLLQTDTVQKELKKKEEIEEQTGFAVKNLDYAYDTNAKPNPKQTLNITKTKYYLSLSKIENKKDKPVRKDGKITLQKNKNYERIRNNANKEIQNYIDNGWESGVYLNYLGNIEELQLRDLLIDNEENMTIIWRITPLLRPDAEINVNIAKIQQETNEIDIDNVFQNSSIDINNKQYGFLSPHSKESIVISNIKFYNIEEYVLTVLYSRAIIKDEKVKNMNVFIPVRRVPLKTAYEVLKSITSEKDAKPIDTYFTMYKKSINIQKEKYAIIALSEKYKNTYLRLLLAYTLKYNYKNLIWNDHHDLFLGQKIQYIDGKTSIEGKNFVGEYIMQIRNSIDSATEMNDVIYIENLFKNRFLLEWSEMRIKDMCVSVFNMYRNLNNQNLDVKMTANFVEMVLSNIYPNCQLKNLSKLKVPLFITKFTTQFLNLQYNPPVVQNRIEIINSDFEKFKKSINDEIIKNIKLLQDKRYEITEKIFKFKSENSKLITIDVNKDILYEMTMKELKDLESVDFEARDLRILNEYKKELAAVNSALQENKRLLENNPVIKQELEVVQQKINELQEERQLDEKDIDDADKYKAYSENLNSICLVLWNYIYIVPFSLYIRDGRISNLQFSKLITDGQVLLKNDYKKIDICNEKFDRVINALCNILRSIQKIRVLTKNVDANDDNIYYINENDIRTAGLILVCKKDNSKRKRVEENTENLDEEYDIELVNAHSQETVDLTSMQLNSDSVVDQLDKKLNEGTLYSINEVGEENTDENEEFDLNYVSDGDEFKDENEEIEGYDGEDENNNRRHEDNDDLVQEFGFGEKSGTKLKPAYKLKVADLTKLINYMKQNQLIDANENGASIATHLFEVASQIKSRNYVINNRINFFG